MMMQKFMEWHQSRSEYDTLDTFIEKYFAHKSDKEVFKNIVHEIYNITCATGEIFSQLDELTKQVKALREGKKKVKKEKKTK